MIDRLIDWFIEMWQRHVVADFPYLPECCPCKKDTCLGCPVLFPWPDK